MGANTVRDSRLRCAADEILFRGAILDRSRGELRRLESAQFDPPTAAFTGATPS
jgi:hypothetical protein